MGIIKEGFSYFTSPSLPTNFGALEKEVMETSKPYKILHDVASIEQIKENLPGQSGYLLLQVSEDKQSMYVAYCQVSKERRFQYHVTKIGLPEEKRSELQAMVERLAALKTSMQKTPITIQEDLEALERESELEVQDLLVALEKFFEPVTSAISSMLHPVLEDAEADEAGVPPASKQGGKPGGKDESKGKAPAKQPGKAPAKGGAGAPAEVAAFESNLPLTTGGVESVVIMVDQMFDTLPLEALSVFKRVAVVSRDFNLHLHLSRLKAVGHRADMHNNTGLAKDELRYIVDLPASESLQEQGGDFVKGEMQKMMPAAKWEGVLTHREHIPSDGEWQQQISQSSLFAYYSMTCLLHKFPSSLISDLSIFNKCRAMAIFDRMNSYKTLIDRNVLTSKHFSPDE